MDTTTQNIIAYSNNELAVLDDNFTNYLNQFKVLSDSLLMNSQFINIINNQKQGQYEYTTQYTLDLQNTLKDVITSFFNIDTLTFIDTNNITISVGYPYFDEVSVLMNKYKDQMDALNGKIVWGYIDMHKGKKVIICRKINYVDREYQLQNIGYMIILVDEETLYNYYSNLKSVNESNFFIFDSNNTIISSKLRDDVGKTFDLKAIKNSSGSQRGEFIYVSRQLNINNWTIAYLILRDKINDNIYKTVNYIARITIICIILSVIVSIFLAKSVNLPLAKLSRSMKQVEQGDFNVIAETKQKNEIGQLYKSFNIMVSKLNQLINKNMAMQLKTKEAQIQSLQRQIDPHFIYNTLDMIRMLSILNENDKIEESVICLSEVLRFNLKAEKEVLIEREINTIEAYFKMLKIRYGENFDYEIKVTEEIKQYYTLKFLLQPFIENAVRHGLERVERKGFICILAKKINGEIVFIIKDNGIGMKREKVEEIKRDLQDERVDGGSCIGMKNVHQRIRLQYGVEYGIDVVSQYNKKTSIILHIPAYIKEEEKTDVKNVDCR